jgi:phage terminase large subunit-like protein
MTNTPDPKWAPAFYSGMDEEEQFDYSQGDLAIELAEYAFANSPTPLKLDQFQRWILREVLKQRNGEFVWNQYFISMGRQNGKTTIVSALMLYLMLVHHPQPNVFTIASTLQQARICYDRFSNLVNSSPSIKKRFRPTTETRGIRTNVGGYLQVSTSKAASLQGHSLTSCVLDELHLLKPETYDAVVIGAGQQKNSLVIGITTAGSEESVLLKRLYEQGKAGLPGLGCAIWEAPENASVTDVEALKAANPALAEGRMDEAQILREVAVLPESDAVRYRLNRFITAENPFLPFGLWQSLDECEYPPQPMKIVADISPGWGAFTLAGAWKKDEEVHTTVLASVIKPSYEQATNLVLRVLEQIPYTEVGISSYWGGALIEALNAKGVRTKRLVKRDDYVAPPLFYEAVATKKIKHDHLDLLNFQMARVGKKDQGDEYRLVRSAGGSEIDVAMATVYACYMQLTDQSSPKQIF